MRSSGNAQIRRNLAAVMALLWVVVATALYFYAYKPFSPPFAQAVGGALLDIAVMGVFTIVAGGLGRWILSYVPLDDWNRAEQIAAAVLVGFSCLAPLILSVGAAALNAFTVAALFLVIAVLVRRHLVKWVAETVRWMHGSQELPHHIWDQIAAVVIIWALALGLLISLLPPTKWDALTYHLAGAQQYVAHGRFYAAAHNHFLGFPQQVDVLYAAQLALTGRLTGSSLLQWSMGSFMLLLVGGMATRRFGLRAGLVAAGAIIVGKSIWLEMTFAYSDLIPMGLAAIGLDAADTWARYRSQLLSNRAVTRQDVKYLIMIGAASGFAMGAKYTTIWLGVALGLLVLWIARHESWRRKLVFVSVYGVAAIIVLSPWLVRNVIWYGNPVYPFLFKTGEMDSIRQAWYRDPGSGMLYTADAWQLPIMPIAATILGFEGGTGYGTSIGPVYLLLCPMLMLTWGKVTAEERKFAIHALLVAGIIMLIWIFAAALVSYANQSTRLVLYMFPPLAIVAGLALDSLYRLPKKPLDLAFVIHAMIAVVLVFTAIDYTQVFIHSGFFTYFSGESRYQEAFLEQELGWHYEAMRQVNALPQGSTVRFLWEPRYLYCDAKKVDCYTDSLMDGWYYARRTVDGGTPASIVRVWKSSGLDYLLVYEFGRKYEKDKNAFYTPEDWAAWDRFADQYLEEVWVGGNQAEPQYVIYQWKSEGLAAN
jgi:hypothetical protein